MNLLVGTENGLMLLDRSGQGKVYNLITRRRFQQMEVLEGLNVLVTISGLSQYKKSLIFQCYILQSDGNLVHVFKHKIELFKPKKKVLNQSLMAALCVFGDMSCFINLSALVIDVFREEKQTTCLLLVMAEKQDTAQ